MYSYKNNGICQKISSCLTVLLEYITKNSDKIRNDKNDKNDKHIQEIQNSKNTIKNDHDYDEFEIL
jgi:hypothetical protein